MVEQPRARHRDVNTTDTRDPESNAEKNSHQTNKVSSEGVDGRISFSSRLAHFTWAWFTLPMSTGGIALLLAEQPHTFHGLEAIGKVIYVFDIVLFLLLCTGITIRFVRDPKALPRSLRDPTESLFFATFWLSMPTIIGGMQVYGAASVGDWLPVVLRVLFWAYLACTLCVSVGQYYFLFTAKALTAHSMTPSWICKASSLDPSTGWACMS